jgi:hypothetical protein
MIYHIAWISRSLFSPPSHPAHVLKHSRKFVASAVLLIDFSSPQVNIT